VRSAFSDSIPGSMTETITAVAPYMVNTTSGRRISRNGYCD
jgi:hypothetical protein